MHEVVTRYHYNDHTRDQYTVTMHTKQDHNSHARPMYSDHASIHTTVECQLFTL